jgi:type I restriction enzyme S subunit
VLDTRDVWTISEIDHRTIYTRCPTRKGDIWLTKDGANCGNAAINTFPCEVSLLSSVAVIRPDPDKLDTRYLLEWILSDAGQTAIAGKARGLAITRVTLAMIRDLKVPLPSLPIQQMIGAIGTNTLDVDAKFDALIAAKREQKRGLMQQLLTGKVRFPGFTEPWKTVRLGEIANLRGSKGTSSHLPHLRCIELEHIESGTGEIIGEASVGSTVSLKTEFAPGDVLFGKLRPYLRKFALVEFAGLCSTEIWALIPDQTVITSGYLRLLVEAPAVQRAANATSGTKMPRADWDVVSTTPVHLPPKSEQDRITLLASAIDSEIRLLSAQRQVLATQRRGLMERLLSGEIDIPSSDTSAA